MASRALVIGAGKYADQEIGSWDEITESARRYLEVLSSDAMWGPGACRILTDEELQTADGVMTALQDTADATGPDDTLLVVYVGHGKYWSDLPVSDQVHFAVGSSYKDRPWTWLSSWYVYRVMRKADARLKVLIADCCFSGRLPHLGGESVLPGILGERDQGTCVFTALKDERESYAPAAGCTKLPTRFAGCTPFSGHLLKVLEQGTRDDTDQLTIGHLREAVRTEMERCPTGHKAPRMSLNNARESTPLFTNRMDEGERRARPAPVEPAEWARLLKVDRLSPLADLLKDEHMTGDVVRHLSSLTDPESQDLAADIDAKANEFFVEPDTFARYWSHVEPTRSPQA
ncbi:hypothetical protein [Streptomyces longisporus]|uniref:Caspase domain-containing protein n=1 Tax=Streptomyces longisporus TaxID=1948 RepID=A0ABN3NHU8_STRLO